MNQKSLFDHEPEPIGHYGFPLARKDDPATSQVAAIEAASKASETHRKLAAWLAKQTEPKTAREMAEGCKRDFSLKCEVETLRKRAGELEDYRDLKVVIAGVRHCSVTGKLAETWETVK